jgi:uncharacterized membrane protein (UPF0127 family)
MHRIALFVLLAAAALSSCGGRSASPEDFGTRVVTLPNGHRIRCEVMIHPKDMARGMMFRDSLDPDRGMLFVHGQPGNYPYWMYQVKIPLDIIWLDSNRRIVEMSLDTPPCEKGPASTCPNYGGKQKAQFVLELAAGVARKHGLQVGQVLEF